MKRNSIFSINFKTNILFEESHFKGRKTLVIYAIEYTKVKRLPEKVSFIG